MKSNAIRQIEKFPVSGLFKVADLIYFDGPLLSLFKTPDGSNYLFYWCDCIETANFWLVFQIAHCDLLDYLQKRKSLYDLLVNNQSYSTVWLAKIDDRLRFQTLYAVPVKKLPDSYIPGKDSIYNFTPQFVNLDFGKALFAATEAGK